MNAGNGPGADAAASPSFGLGEDVGRASSLGDGIVGFAGGGGSIPECVVGALDGTTGSGNGAIASSDEAVSIVIWVVALGAVR